MHSPAKQRVFRLPRSRLVVHLLCSAALALLMAILFQKNALVNMGGGELLLCGVLSAIALGSAWDGWRELETIVVDDHEIRRTLPGLHPVSIGWHEIEWIGEDARFALLVGGRSGSMIRIRPLIVGFDDLVRRIRTSAPDAAPSRAGIELADLRFPIVYRLPIWKVLAIEGIFFLLAFVFWWFEGFNGNCCVLVGLGIISLPALMTSWHSLIVVPDALVLRSLFRQRVIPFLELHAASLRTSIDRTEHGIPMGIRAFMALELRDGTVILIHHLGEEVTEARDVIEALLRRKTTAGG